MRAKLWRLNIRSCGISQDEAADQARRLLTMMVKGKHMREYTRVDLKGNAVGNWTEGPEVEYDNCATESRCIR